jgi:hypothetical protein
MNATRYRRQDWLQEVLRSGVNSGRPEWKGPPPGNVPADGGFFVAGLGVGIFGGYFPRDAFPRQRARVLHQQRRFHAQAPSGDLQSSAGIAPYCKRSQRRAAQLPFLFGIDRALPGFGSASPAFARDTAVHVMRAHRPLHRRRCLTISARAVRTVATIDLIHPAYDHSRQAAGSDFVVGYRAQRFECPRSRIRLSRISGEDPRDACTTVIAPAGDEE